MKKQVKTSNDLPLFKIERGIPHLYSRGNSLEQVQLREKVTKVTEKIKVDESFCVPKSSKSTILRHLRITRPEFSFRSGSIAGNPKTVRIWRKG